MTSDAAPSDGQSPPADLPTRPSTPGVEFPSFATLATMAHLDAAIDPIVFESPVVYTIDELAERSGATVEQILNFTKWIGRPARGGGEIRYTEADVSAVRYALQFAETEHLDHEALGALIRGMASSMERLAMRQVEALIQTIGNRENLSDTDARLAAAHYAPARAAMLQPLIDHTYRRHYAAAVHRLTTDAVAQRGLHDGDSDYPLMRAIGFADLVNFTARTKDASPREFTQMVHDFSDTCWEVVYGYGGRIVNFIGDAVFFTADDIETGADIALRIADPATLGSCGPVRVGLVWARVVSTYGDIFGPGVNLAARLAEAAKPTEVMIGPLATDLLKRNPEFHVEPRPEVEAHGIGLVKASRLTYANAAGTTDEPPVTIVDA